MIQVVNCHTPCHAMLAIFSPDTDIYWQGIWDYKIYIHTYHCHVFIVTTTTVPTHSNKQPWLKHLMQYGCFRLGQITAWHCGNGMLEHLSSMCQIHGLILDQISFGSQDRKIYNTNVVNAVQDLQPQGLVMEYRPSHVQMYKLIPAICQLLVTHTNNLQHEI